MRSMQSGSPHRTGRRAAFTLLELILVMIVLGIIAGIGVAGIDRMDPGNRGLRTSVETFLESSRDRARVSGHAVSVQLQPATEERDARFLRHVYRRAIEATFESGTIARQSLRLHGTAETGIRGRLGAGASLPEGGAITLEGGRTPDVRNGFSMSLDLRNQEFSHGQLFHWEGLLTLEVNRVGVLEATLRAGEDQIMRDFVLESPPATIRPGDWQHLKVVAADGSFQMWVDGIRMASMSLPPMLGSALGAPAFGDEEKGWHGLIDEFAFWVRTAEAGAELPRSFEWQPAPLLLTFDRNGRLDAARHPGSVDFRVSDLGEEVFSIAIGRFTQEAGQ